MKLRGGPYDGQSAVSYGAVVGSLIEVNARTYRVTRIEPVPGRREEMGTALFDPRPTKTPASKDKPAL